MSTAIPAPSVPGLVGAVPTSLGLGQPVSGLPNIFAVPMNGGTASTNQGMSTGRVSDEPTVHNYRFQKVTTDVIPQALIFVSRDQTERTMIQSNNPKCQIYTPMTFSELNRHLYAASEKPQYQSSESICDLFPFIGVVQTVATPDSVERKHKTHVGATVTVNGPAVVFDLFPGAVPGNKLYLVCEHFDSTESPQYKTMGASDRARMDFGYEAAGPTKQLASAAAAADEGGFGEAEITTPGAAASSSAGSAGAGDYKASAGVSGGGDRGGGVALGSVGRAGSQSNSRGRTRQEAIQALEARKEAVESLLSKARAQMIAEDALYDKNKTEARPLITPGGEAFRRHQERLNLLEAELARRRAEPTEGKFAITTGPPKKRSSYSSSLQVGTYNADKAIDDMLNAMKADYSSEVSTEEHRNRFVIPRGVVLKSMEKAAGPIKSNGFYQFTIWVSITGAPPTGDDLLHHTTNGKIKAGLAQKLGTYSRRMPHKEARYDAKTLMEFMHPYRAEANVNAKVKTLPTCEIMISANLK